MRTEREQELLEERDTLCQRAMRAKQDLASLQVAIDKLHCLETDELPIGSVAEITKSLADLQVYVTRKVRMAQAALRVCDAKRLDIATRKIKDQRLIWTLGLSTSPVRLKIPCCDEVTV